MLTFPQRAGVFCVDRVQSQAHLAAGDAPREDAADVGVAAGLQGQAVDDAVNPLFLHLRKGQRTSFNFPPYVAAETVPHG